MNLVTPRMETSGSIIVSSRPAVGQVGEDDRHKDDYALDRKIQVVGDPHQVDAVLDDLSFMEHGAWMRWIREDFGRCQLIRRRGVSWRTRLDRRHLPGRARRCSFR
jgi:hypothetical protein